MIEADFAQPPIAVERRTRVGNQAHALRPKFVFSRPTDCAADAQVTNLDRSETDLDRADAGLSAQRLDDDAFDPVQRDLQATIVNAAITASVTVSCLAEIRIFRLMILSV
jgi:hypothetical protein